MSPAPYTSLQPFNNMEVLPHPSSCNPGTTVLPLQRGSSFFDMEDLAVAHDPSTFLIPEDNGLGQEPTCCAAMLSPIFFPPTLDEDGLTGPGSTDQDMEHTFRNAMMHLTMVEDSSDSMPMCPATDDDEELASCYPPALSNSAPASSIILPSSLPQPYSCVVTTEATPVSSAALTHVSAVLATLNNQGSSIPAAPVSPAPEVSNAQSNPSKAHHTYGYQQKSGGPCDHCGTKESPQWRRGPPSKPMLCNACGTRYRRTNQLGPPGNTAAGRSHLAAAASSAALAAGPIQVPRRTLKRDVKEMVIEDPVSPMSDPSHPLADSSSASFIYSY